MLENDHSKETDSLTLSREAALGAGRSADGRPVVHSAKLGIGLGGEDAREQAEDIVPPSPGSSVSFSLESEAGRRVCSVQFIHPNHP